MIDGSSLYNMHSSFAKCKVLLFYNGFVTQDIIENMSRILMQTLSLENTNPLTANAIYGIFIELAQNIDRYSAEKLSDGIPSGIFRITRYPTGENMFCNIECGNLVSRHSAEILSKNLKNIKCLSYDSLKALYREKLLSRTDEISKNAGLGLIEMAVKSRNCFEYSFTRKDENNLFFEINITLSEPV